MKLLICLISTILALTVVGCHRDEPVQMEAEPSQTVTNPRPTDLTAKASPQTSRVRPQVPLAALSLKEFDDWWQIDLDVQEQPLEQVLEQLIQEIPNWSPKLVVKESRPTSPTEQPVENGPILQRKVSLKLTRVSALEAIEQACQAAGVHPRYDVDFASGRDVLELHPGPRVPTGIAADEFDPSQPLRWVRFVGPVAIQFAELEQNVPNATGQFSLHLAWPQLPPAVAELSGVRPFAILSVTSSGQDLMGNIAEIGIFVSKEPTGLERSGIGRELHHLLRRITAIEEIRGRVTFKIPTAVKTVWFDKIESNWAMDEGNTTVILNRVSKHFGKETHVRYSIRQPEPIAGLKAFAFDATGKLLDSPSFSSSGASWSKDGMGSGDFSCEGEAAHLAVVVITRLEVFEQDFVFTEIPLSQSSEQPEMLTELVFDGHDVPLSFEVLGIEKDQVFHKVRLKAVNHSNKDIRKVEVIMNYLDANNQHLEDHNPTLRGKDVFSDEPFLKARTMQKVEEIAHFFPDNATQILLEVKTIQFADGTSWKPTANEL